MHSHSTIHTFQVTKEERRVARDKMTYASLKQAWVVNRDDPQGRSAAGVDKCGCLESVNMRLIYVQRQFFAAGS